MPAPVVTAISPASGLPAGGTVVSITGTNLASATGVSFGAVPATVFASLSATQVVADAPAGTGNVHVTVTTADGTSAPSSADYFAYVAATTGLFTVAEARAFNTGELKSASDYTNAEILAKEIEVRSLFTNACKVDFVPTQHADEYHDGYGSQSILLDWPRVIAITSASNRIGTAWTALTADELAALQSSVPGEVQWNDGYWPVGVGSVKVTYTAGYPDVPPLIKRAALEVAVNELPPSNVPWQADGYDAGGTSYSWTRGDGYAGAWSGLPNVMLALRLYDHSGIGIG